jgi:hypothetical protein
LRTTTTFTKADYSGYEARLDSPAVLTDRGLKELYGSMLDGNVTLPPGESWQKTFSFPYQAGDASTWALWFYLEDIRTTAASDSAGAARADVYFDGTNDVPVYFSNQAGWSGPFMALTPWADPKVPHTVKVTNSGNSSLTVGAIWYRWLVNCTTNVANAHAADDQVATDIHIPPYGGHFTFTLQFPWQSRDKGTWACWLMFHGIETGSASPEAGESKVQLWLDGNNYTTFALNNQGKAETLQEAITWSEFIGNTNTIDPRSPHTVMLVNLDSQPVVIPNLWVRWFVPYAN